MRKAYLMNVKDLPLREVFSLLPAWRREKAERLRFEKDKKASAGVWLLLMYAIKKEGLSCGEVAFSEQGKPCFTDEALPRFCLSHSGDYVLCAIADEEVGCDVQEKVSPSLRLIDRVCTEREKPFFLASPQGKLSSECETDEVVFPTSSAACGRHLSPAGSVPVRLSMSTGHRFTAEPRFAPRRGRQEDIFTSLWAKKESLAKLSGEGMAADFAHLETPPDPCLFVDNCAVYAYTKSGGFPQETAVVDLTEVLAYLKT